MNKWENRYLLVCLLELYVICPGEKPGQISVNEDNYPMFKRYLECLGMRYPQKFSLSYQDSK